MTKIYTKMTEIYDLHTQVGKIGLIGIKTPTGSSITNNYRGLLVNFKNIKFLKCDVRLACASTLPVDPLQLGFEAGQQLDPRDLFEPLLYKAVSNGSMSRILHRIYGTPTQGDLDGDSVQYYDQVVPSQTIDGVEVPDNDPYDVYHSLLSNEGFRKAMPQMGLSMSGLRPYVWPMTTTVRLANTGLSVNTKNPGLPGGLEDSELRGTDQYGIISGRPIPMPSVPTLIPLRSIGSATTTPKEPMAPGKINVLDDPLRDEAVNNTSGGTNTQYDYSPVYVGAIITPPARNQQLYYRMSVTWHMVFSGLRSVNDISTFNMMEQFADSTYHTDYAIQSQAMSLRGDSVDTGNVPMEPVTTTVA